jgi:hypothetical protein
LEEVHQTDAALCLLDESAELLVGSARSQTGEHTGNVGLADAREDAVQDGGNGCSLSIT